MDIAIDVLIMIITQGGLFFIALLAGVGFYSTFLSGHIIRWPWVKPNRRVEVRNTAFSTNPRQRGEIAAIYGFIIGVTRHGFADPDIAVEEAERYTNRVLDNLPDAHKTDFLEGVEQGVNKAREAIEAILTDDYVHNTKPRTMAAIDLKANELRQLHGEDNELLSRLINALVKHLKQAIP